MDEGICQRCGKNPGVREVEVQFSGTKQLWNVCPSCLSELLGEAAESKSPGGGCPNCGWTAAEFKKTKKLGCAQCYSTFHHLIQGWLRHEGYPYAYEGPLPKLRSENEGRKMVLSELEAELHSAVQQERYEEAVVLRDRLKRLQSGGDE